MRPLSGETLIVSLILVVIIRATTFVLSIFGKEVSPGVRFLLSLLGSVLAVVSAGHTETISTFTEDLLALFASVQATYNTVKRMYFFLVRLFASR